MNRPGNPTELKLLDIAFGLLGEGHYKCHFGPEKAICPHCEKTVKAVGLGQHIKDKHEVEND